MSEKSYTETMLDNLATQCNADCRSTWVIVNSPFATPQEKMDALARLFHFGAMAGASYEMKDHSARQEQFRAEFSEPANAQQSWDV